ncbi:MAG TPA: GNAT family protein [bacterium]|nr:GNAT family protein [bacterium]
MTIRTIRAEELGACCALGGAGWLADVVRRFWREGKSSPDLCFVAENDGNPVGRVFFLYGRSSTAFDMFGMYVDESVDFRETGRGLLTTALARLARSGATGTKAAIYDIYERDPARKQELLEAVGFGQFQEKKRYVWQDAGAAIEVPTRLEYRSMAIVGEGAFADAARRVTEGSLDREDKADVAEYGLDYMGQRYMAILKDVEFLPDQWQLGYLPDGSLCGLVVPQRIEVDNEGSINYIGVVPELRGSGYGFDLLMKGTALLQERGLKTVVAETDMENRPMHSALERAGYEHQGTLRVFSCDLTHPAEG